MIDDKFLKKVTSSNMQNHAGKTFDKAKEHPIEITRQAGDGHPAEFYVMMTADYFEKIMNQIK